jgi:hypothetical protein
MTLKARLHPVGKHGSYNVLFEGKLLVERSRESELDACRAMFAQGVTGKLTILDGKTGRPRSIVDIEKAAKLTVKEGPLRFVKTQETMPDQPHSPETDMPDTQVA